MKMSEVTTSFSVSLIFIFVRFSLWVYPTENTCVLVL